MIIMTLRMVAQSEKRDEIVQTVRGTLEPIRVEPGCISCRFYQDTENRNAFTLVGEWETQDDLERHLRTNTFKTLLMLMDFSRERPEIKFNTISHTAGIESVRLALGMNNRGGV